MTPDEAKKPFSMMAANWPFLKFEDDTTFELWFSQLAKFQAAEVTEGVKRAIAEINHTPTVADVLPFVDAVRSQNRRAEEQHNARVMFGNAVRCRDCDDYGFVNIVYPDGSEAVRPCDCDAGHAKFGAGFFASANKTMTDKEYKLHFGDAKPDSWQLVRVKRVLVPDGTWHEDKETHEKRQGMMWGFVPGSSPGEVWLKWEVRRKS